MSHGLGLAPLHCAACRHHELKCKYMHMVHLKHYWHYQYVTTFKLHAVIGAHWDGVEKEVEDECAALHDLANC